MSLLIYYLKLLEKKREQSLKASRQAIGGGGPARYAGGWCAAGAGVRGGEDAARARLAVEA